MAIHYTCRCGAHIRMPARVAGRKARCNSCGLIFTVPSADGPEPDRPRRRPEPPPLASPDADASTAPTSDADEPGDWLAEFARAEEQAAPSAVPGADSAPPTVDAAKTKPPSTSSGDDEWYPSSNQRPELIDLAEAEPDTPPLPKPAYARSTAAAAPEGRDEQRSGVIEPRRPYWAELAGSFLFFLDAGSFVTFLIIVMINLWTVPLSYAGLFGTIGLLLISGYLCTFYMSVILETASGEDELPNVWIDSVFDDVVLAAVRFIGTWAWVLLPAMAFAIIEFVNYGQVHWDIVTVLAVVGLLFWPVVIMGVSIGGGFFGLWPWTIIRTAAAAPLAYAALCAVLLIAAGLAALPHSALYLDAITTVGKQTNRSLFWSVTFLNSTLSAYAIIVAMRAIGLYYRHYKHKFPWVAE